MPSCGTGKDRWRRKGRICRLTEEKMDDEDDLPRRTGWEPRNLESLSIDQLQDYIAVLEGEIARVRADIAAKRSDLGAAEAIFKK